MTTDDPLADVDLDAWQPPTPPAGLADAVLRRMREPTPASAREVEERRWWRWWVPTVALASAATGSGILASFWLASPDPVIQGHGDVVAVRPSHVEIGASSAEVDADTEVRWRRDGKAVTVQQPRGAATWRVDPADDFMIDPGAVGASIEASGASLRVEVEMQHSKSDTRVAIPRAVAAAAVALVTVVVYNGHADVASAGETVRVEAGDTVEVTPGAAPRLLEVGARADTYPVIAGGPDEAGPVTAPVIADAPIESGPVAASGVTVNARAPGASAPVAAPGQPAPRPSPQRQAPASPPVVADALPANKARNIPPAALEPNRIRGNRNIMPDEFVKRAMQSAGETKIITSVKMCIDTSGDVSDVRILKSSGYPGYDETIVDEIWNWGFKPYEVDGKAVAVCTAVTFIYKQS